MKKNRGEVQQLAGQLALFRHPLHRRQQRGQGGTILRPRIFLPKRGPTADVELFSAGKCDGYLADPDEVLQSAQQVRWLPGRCRKLMPNKRHATQCMQQRAARIRQFTSDCSSIGDGSHGKSASTPPCPRRQTNEATPECAGDGALSGAQVAGRHCPRFPA